MKIAIFDIETGPRPAADLNDVMPEFKAPGNFKDPEKIAAAIAEQKAEWIDRAALSAVTGRVVAVGWLADGKPTIIDCSGDNEPAGLRTLWGMIEDAVRERRIVVGFNSNRFDIPFLTRRSWACGVPVPTGIYAARGYVNGQVFIDLVDEWQCGDRQATIKLDMLARFLGCGAKNGDGKEFAGLWETDRPKAVEYLENDLRMTANVAERLLGLDPMPAWSRHADASDADPRVDGDPAPEYKTISPEGKAILNAAIEAKKNPRKPRAPRSTAPTDPPLETGPAPATTSAPDAVAAPTLELSNDY